MKQIIFSLLLLMSVPFFFASCAEDMYENTTSLEDLYRQRAAEFSKKYGVDVILNENKIEELIATKSIDDLEVDIRDLAAFFGSLSVDNSSKQATSLKKKMKIRRRKTLRETNPFKGSFERTFSFTGYAQNGSQKYRITNAEGRAEVSWDFGNGGSGLPKMDMEITTIGGSRYKGNLSTTGVPVLLSEYGVKFTYNSDILLYNEYYCYYYIRLGYGIDVDEANNFESLTISIPSFTYNLDELEEEKYDERDNVQNLFIYIKEF